MRSIEYPCRRKMCNRGRLSASCDWTRLSHVPQSLQSTGIKTDIRPAPPLLCGLNKCRTLSCSGIAQPFLFLTAHFLVISDPHYDAVLKGTAFLISMLPCGFLVFRGGHFSLMRICAKWGCWSCLPNLTCGKGIFFWLRHKKSPDTKWYLSAQAPANPSFCARIFYVEARTSLLLCHTPYRCQATQTTTLSLDAWG